MILNLGDEGKGRDKGVIRGDLLHDPEHFSHLRHADGVVWELRGPIAAGGARVLHSMLQIKR